jgi:hypothetical protein
MNESQPSTRRERQCRQTDQRGNPCSKSQILRDDAEQPFSRTRWGKDTPYSTPVIRPGWQCEDGHFDEPTPDEVLFEACRLLLELDRKTSEMLDRFEFRSNRLRTKG